MSINLLDNSLNVEVYFESSDSEFCDNICVRFWESCPEEERIFRSEETNIFITAEQARILAFMLLEQAQQSDGDCSGDHGE